MNGIGRAAKWSLALGGAAIAANAVRHWLSKSPLASRRFAYVTEAASGEETLRLAELSVPARGVKRTARTLRNLATVPGEEPFGEVPETFTRLVSSPGNRRMAVLSAQVGLDFVDHNIRLVDLVSGGVAPFFNEHRFSTINRATCPSAVFEAFLVTEAAAGTPPDVLAAYDWTVLLEGEAGANIPAPELAWADDDTLVVGFRFRVVLTIGPELGEELFRFRIVPGALPGDFEPWTLPPPPPPPAGPLSIAPPTAAKRGAILLNGAVLPFVERKLAIGWLPFLSRWKRAKLVAGLVS
jgi:hypothetical protein